MMMKEPYFFEKSLPSRVRGYMEENDYKYLNVREMTDHLINTYDEYKLKNKKLFMKSVAKAHKWELYRYQQRSTTKDVNSGKLGNIEDTSDIIHDIDEDEEVVELESKENSFLVNDVNKAALNTFDRFTSGMEESPIKSLKKDKLKRKMDVDEVQMTNILKRKKVECHTPSASLEDMKGISKIHEMACLLAMSLLEDNLDVDAPKRALLIGPEGSGKTTFVTSLAGDVGANLIRISVSEFCNGGPEAETTLKQVFKTALTNTPSILLLENMDYLASKDYGVSKGVEKKTCDLIQSSLSDLELKHSDKRILVIAEVRSPQGMDLNLRGKFKTEIFMPPLDPEARISLLKTFAPTVTSDVNFTEIAVRTSSFVAGDLKDLVQRARHAAWKRMVQEELGKDAFAQPKKFFSQFSSFANGKKLQINLKDFISALPMVTPTLKREGFPVVPDTTWEDVGGLDDIKSELKEKILEPMQYWKLHEQFKAKQPNGIILWGPPGCGKTLLAKAVANHAGVNLYAVMGPELLNMYQGESERAIRDVFKRASAVAPCVIFFDEFDCICPRRVAGADSGSKTTIVNTLLVEMNGFTRRKDVYVMAATNRPDMVDPAVLRPERFDTSLYVGLPDQKGRVAVFKACTKNGTEPKLSFDVDLEDISERCTNFSGADCAHLVYTASKCAISEKLKEGHTVIEEEVGTLSKRHFDLALKRVFPSIGIEEQKKYKRMKVLFEHSKSQSSTAPEMRSKQSSSSHDSKKSADIPKS